MRGIHIALLERAPTVRTVRLQKASPTPASTELLYAPLPRRFPVDDVADLLYALPERVRGISRAIILRAHRYEAGQVLRGGSRCTTKLLARFRRLPVYLFHWNEELDSFELVALSDNPGRLIEPRRRHEGC